MIGLGYVGLPLACLLSSKYEVRGFDISRKRLQEIMRLHDSTHEDWLTTYSAHRRVWKD